MTAGHGEKLTRRQEVAVAALLATPTIGTAAEAAKVSESTLRRWLQRPDFAEAYQAARRQALAQTIGRLAQDSARAVGVLAEVMDNREAPPAVRASAAKALIELAMRGAELSDFAERLAAIEALVSQAMEAKTQWQSEGD